MGNSRHNDSDRSRQSGRPESRVASHLAAWLRPESARRYILIALGVAAGFILGTMAVQGWLDQREYGRETRDIVRAAVNQGSVPVNLFFAETLARMSVLEAVADESPMNALRLEPGYRRYDVRGSDAGGGPPLPAIAEAVTVASRTGVQTLSMPFQHGGRWYAAIVTERLDSAGTLVGYHGVQFPLSLILDWWSTIRLPSGSAAALVTADGRIWLRDPFVPSLIGVRAADDPYAAAIEADPGQLSRIVDYHGGGVDAIVGWRTLEVFGLVFSVGVDSDQVDGDRSGLSTMPLLVSLLATLAAFLVVAVGGQAMPGRAIAPAMPTTPPTPVAQAPETASTGPRAVAENIPVVVFEQRVGPGDRIAYDYVSNALREVHGIEPERLQARPEILFEMIHPDDRAQATADIQESWKSGADLDIEYRIVTPAGTVKWVHNIARAGRTAADGAGRVWDGVVLDVTAQKQSAAELRPARDEVEVGKQVRADFVANVSHELRQPLNAIIGFAEIIAQEEYGPVGVDKYLEYARDIHESADYLLAVVNDILDMSKIEAGRATLVLEEVDAAELADSCLRLIHGRAAEARLQLRRHVEDMLPTLLVDPLKIKQILINLLSNSIKFTRPGGTVTLRVTSTADGGLAFSVIDTGIGIPEQELSVAIESYGQAGSLSGGSGEGTGLGLPLAKALAELHGGQLLIESTAGRGTTVTARFPPGCIAPPKRTGI